MTRQTVITLCLSLMVVATAGCFGDSSGAEDYYPEHDATYDSMPYDAAADTAGDSLPLPDAPPDTSESDAATDTDAVEDADDEDAEPPNVCDEEIDEPQVLYLSADDSNSQASPVYARKMIEQGRIVPWYSVRTYEFLNYYNLSYELPEQGRVTVVAQMQPDPDPEEDGLYNLQIGVQGHHMGEDMRRPMNVTFSLDTSGSMSGDPINLLKAVCRQIAANLREGDVVSMVIWSDTQAVTLESHVVSGPDDDELLDAISRLESGGSTNLHAGLVTAYELAEANYREGWLNRVVLISDGQANTGETDHDLIAAHADDSEREGIYLVGVGTGNGYDDTLMDTVTDKGKGAYIFIDSEEEAVKMFGEKFVSSMEIAVMDVQVQLTIPPVLRMEVFYGEEVSGNPKEVEPQHLAPDDAMIYQLSLRSCWELGEEDTIKAVASYVDPATRAGRTDSFEANALDLLEGASVQLGKGYAIVAYAEALKEIDKTADISEQAQLCSDAKAKVDAAAAALDDDDLDEISSLLETYCRLFGG
ncbi:MAG: von Willebrand factor type A domain-containing protein [Pseudomonadota bacterium]